MTEPNQPLSDRELEILRLVATGATNKEIASQLVISVNTVKVHLRNIFGKIGVVSRTEAAMWAVQAGVVESPQSVPIADEPADDAGVSKQNFVQKRRYWLVGAGIITVVFLIISFLGYRLWRNHTNEAETFATVQNFEQDRWTSLAEMPTPRDGFASSVADNKIFVMGGETETGVTSSVDYYDVETNQWNSVTAMPVALVDIQAATIGGKIYVPGGQLNDGKLSDQLFVYNPGEDSWQNASSLPVSLCSYALTAFEGKLYLFGGWDGSRFVNLVFEYDPTTDTWKEKSPMSVSRGWSGAVVSSGKIHVVGGYDGEKALDIHETYSPEQDQPGENPWETLSPLPMGLSQFGIANVAEIIHIIGGEAPNSAVFHAYRYTSQTDQWQNFSTPFETEWFSAGVAGIGDKIYLYGGRMGNQTSTLLVSYQAVYYIMIPILE